MIIKNKEKQSYTTIYNLNDFLVNSISQKLEFIKLTYFNENRKYNIFSKLEDIISFGDSINNVTEEFVAKSKKELRKELDFDMNSYEKAKRLLNKIKDKKLIEEDLVFLRYFDFFLDLEDEEYKKDEEGFIEKFRTKVVYNIQEILKIDGKIKDLFIDISDDKENDFDLIDNGIKKINNLINKKELIKKDLIEYMEEKLDKKTEYIYSENNGSFKKYLEKIRIELLKKYNENNNDLKKEVYLYSISGASGISFAYFEDKTITRYYNQKSNNYINIISGVNKKIEELGYKNIEIKGVIETYLFRKRIMNENEEIYNKENSFVSEMIFFFDNNIDQKKEIMIDMISKVDKNKIVFPIPIISEDTINREDYSKKNKEYVIEYLPRKIVFFGYMGI
jgi:hypothetical protein